MTAFLQNVSVLVVILGCCFSAGGAAVNFHVLKEFDLPPQPGGDGVYPNTPGVGSGDGMLYGTAWRGGVSNQGTIYKMSDGGQAFEVLWRFGDVPHDGIGPLNIEDGRDGWLYGSTYYGGSSNVGTLFRLRKDGSGYAILHDFKGGALDGRNPIYITLANDGFIYGENRRVETNDNPSM